MGNTTTLNDPDGQAITTGKQVMFVYPVDPVTNKPYSIVSSAPPDTITTGNLTVAQPTVGTVVAGGTVSLNLGTGQGTFEVQLTGTFSSGTTIQFEGTDDTGVTVNWFSAIGYNTAIINPTPITSIGGPGPFIIRGSAAGYQQLRVRASALTALDNVGARLIGTTSPISLGGGSMQFATADSLPTSSMPIAAIGLYNSSGALMDRLRDAGSVGDSVTTGFISVQQMLFNGGSSDRLRTPTVFIPLASVAITAGTPTAVWTPTGGRKFHLMGYCVTCTVNGAIIFKDGTTEILRIPVLAGTPSVNPGNFGNGYAGTTSNQDLNFDVTSSGSVSGYVFGTAEF